MTAFKRILLIDDDPVNNHLSKFIIKRVLQTNEVDVISFTDPEKGLEYVADSNEVGGISTLIFLDINMPVLTGWDVLEKLAALDPDLIKHFTIYILSSSIDPIDLNKAEANPLVKGYVSKPLNSQIENIFKEAV